jgi:hypothetical protein
VLFSLAALLILLGEATSAILSVGIILLLALLLELFRFMQFIVTGTSFQGLHPLNIDEAELRRRLGGFVASPSASTWTSEAIARSISGQGRSAVSEVPFSSACKLRRS